jgi:hypothetical protein
LAEPFPGHTKEELASSLSELGAERVSILMSGFVSALALPSVLEAIDGMADIHIQARKLPRLS